MHQKSLQAYQTRPRQAGQARGSWAQGYCAAWGHEDQQILPVSGIQVQTWCSWAADAQEVEADVSCFGAHWTHLQGDCPGQGMVTQHQTEILVV